MPDIRTENSASHGRFSDVLGQCRDMALIFSDAQISELFDHAGGALLDFAERAENNTIQGRFFEAMTLIQGQRPDIEHIFRRELTSGFDNLGKPAVPPPQSNPASSQPSDSELSLIAQDEMEEFVASENLVTKASADCYPQLHALSQRLTVVNGGKKIRESEIPAGPQHLVDAFRRAIRGLELEVKIKVILYALFDKFVVKEAKSLYDELNSSLRAAGILPNLRPVHVPPPSSRADTESASRQAPPDGAPAARNQEAEQNTRQQVPSLGAELFDSIIKLMSKQRPDGSSFSDRLGGPPSAIDPRLAEESSRQLVTALDAVQSRKANDRAWAGTSAASGEIPRLEIDTAFLEKIKQTLSAEREQVLATIDRDNLSPMDADLIDLIGMLFEYMLNDPVLPNLAKALLSHLHTPYLKVALIDRRLLVDAQHPARRLLDQMVEAGSLWVDEANPQRGIFSAMQRVVDRVLQEFTDDVSLFEELLGTFEAAMDEQQRRTDTMEQRTQEAARGREKLQLAKRRAIHHIQTLLKAHPVPQPVSAFLSRTWLDQLVFILLREKQEERSDTWRQAVTTSDDLVALFDPKIGTAARHACIQGIPDLKRCIFEGVQRMGSYSHTALEDLFSLLDTPATWEAEFAAAGAAESTEPARERSANAPPTDEAQQAVSEKEQEVIKRLRKMKFGTWFEFSSDTGGAPRRIKLSWLSPLTSTCMFVDRSGMQAEINTLQELAQEILSSRARVIPRPKHPFIERALVSIRKMLQGENGDKNEAAKS